MPSMEPPLPLLSADSEAFALLFLSVELGWVGLGRVDWVGWLGRLVGLIVLDKENEVHLYVACLTHLTFDHAYLSR